MPDLVPGPITVTFKSENQRLAMRRNWVVTVGAEEAMAMPLTALRRSSPSRSSSWVSIMACSSGVRSTIVEMRQ